MLRGSLRANKSILLYVLHSEGSYSTFNMSGYQEPLKHLLTLTTVSVRSDRNF